MSQYKYILPSSSFSFDTVDFSESHFVLSEVVSISDKKRFCF